MTNLTHSLLFFSCSLSLVICVAIAGSRPAHGPAYLNPSAFSPEAYDFFHPKSSLTDNNSPRNSHSLPFLSPSPSPSMTSNVEADTQGSKVSSDEHIGDSRREEGRGETVGIVPIDDEDLNDEGPGEALTSPVSLSQTNSTEDLEVYDDEEDGDFSDLVLRTVVLLKGDGVVLAKVDETEEN
ncbi:hypothetical protein YC2023_035095 [Brassica napus]|uniref:(rape) hypothetical protein n=1 Tax=Brassica napus TaxID=3708 RepID=A0A816I885_BRANA|nr:unnamed protein product [Brassica napus]